MLIHRVHDVYANQTENQSLIPTLTRSRMLTVRYAEHELPLQKILIIMRRQSTNSRGQILPMIPSFRPTVFPLMIREYNLLFK